MKLTKLYTISIILALGVVSSCNEDEFLNKLPIAQSVEGDFPNTEKDAILATNGVYNTLRIWNINEGGFPILNIVSDDQLKGTSPSDGGGIAPYDDFTYTQTEGSMDRWWRTLYQGIRRANLVISALPTIDMDEELKNRLEGESRFLRAYFYSILVRAYGDVVKVTEVNASFDLLRSPKEEIYSEIIFPDLMFAAENLPVRSDYATEDAGRITEGAVKALLARLYLFRGEFGMAETYAMEVINSMEYDLEADFADAHSVVGEYGVEAVFEIGAIASDFGNGGHQYGNTQAVRGTPNKGWGFGRPAYSLITDWDMSDPRMDQSIIFLGETIDGITISGDGQTPDTTYENSVIVEIEVYNQKVWTPGTNTEESFGHNKRIIRFSDVLLMAAEALNENDNPTEALVHLNRVRQRARNGNPGILPDITTTDKTQLRQVIYDERRFELAFEGLRFWDLVRTGRASTVLGPLGFQSNKNELFPIPQAEIDISEGRITQNTGY